MMYCGSGKRASNQNALKSGPTCHFNNFNVPMNCSDIQPTGNKRRGEVSWSIYKQMINTIQPKKLSCMAASNDMISTGSIGVKAKVKEMQQLERDVQIFIANETPIERIKRTFATNKTTGILTPQQQLLKSIMNSSVGICFFIGGYNGFYDGREEFMRVNKLTMFATKGAASKRRAQHQFKCFLKGGATLAVKGGIFCTFLCGMYLGIEVYLNRSTPWTLSLALGVTGSLVKIGLGPKGMFSGFILGSIIGAAGGLAMYAMLKSSGNTQEELNYREVKDLFIAKRRFTIKDMNPVTEYHEEVDDIE